MAAALGDASIHHGIEQVPAEHGDTSMIDEFELVLDAAEQEIDEFELVDGFQLVPEHHQLAEMFGDTAAAAHDDISIDYVHDDTATAIQAAVQVQPGGDDVVVEGAAHGDTPIRDEIPGVVHPVASYIAEGLVEVPVQSVWQWNYLKMFKIVHDALCLPHRRIYIAFDFEFAADAFTDVRYWPKCTTTSYNKLCRLVNGGDVVQMGIAFVFEDGVEEAPTITAIALEINFDFSEESREYNRDSIAFLSDHGHRLMEHKDIGVLPQMVYTGLLSRLPFGNSSVTWIAYHGDYDTGFFLRLLQGGGSGRSYLPHELTTFMHQMRVHFPTFYDVRVLGQLVKDGFSGKLIDLADFLGVEIDGNNHHAGFDALLTMACFFKIVSTIPDHQLYRLDAREGLLAGIAECSEAIKDALHIDEYTSSFEVIKVFQENFSKEAKRIEELVLSNFNIIGVEVAHHWEKNRDSTQVIIVTFMNSEGMLAYGCVWEFCISFTQADGDYLHPRQFTRLMASCGSMSNPTASWVTFHGSDTIASLIKTFSATQDLPTDWPSYIEQQRAYFPNMYDVAMIAQSYPDPTRCKGGLFDVARALGLEFIEDNNLVTRVLLTLRCYWRLAERDDFLHIASAVQGLLMENCCWSCPANRSLVEDA
uniref:Exonuclease domain-containing protein n=1 Tax=Leersia perrieri TaxID=77586 RepID=A0A0D9XJU2_9ORYZ